MRDALVYRCGANETAAEKQSNGFMCERGKVRPRQWRSRQSYMGLWSRLTQIRCPNVQYSGYPSSYYVRWKKGGSHPKFPHVPTRAVDLPGGPRTMGRSSSEEGGIISKTVTWNCELWICTGLSLTALLRNLSTGVSAVELSSQCQGLSTLLSLMYVGRDAEEIPT